MITPQKTNQFKTMLYPVLVLLVSLNCFGSMVSPQDQAKRILEQTGIKGGLIVHVGCGDGKLTAALGAEDSFMVQGLDADARSIEKAREHISSLGQYGRISIDKLSPKELPYIDNLVNLVVVEKGGQIASDEILRVLTPGGVALTRKGEGWTRISKSRPKEMDEWTHYFHDPSNNPVAHDDIVGPPRRYQWIGSPRWSRHHDHMASMNALVSAGGRVFYIMDEGSKVSIQLPAKWSLIARDAFNGTILWKRPIPTWNTHKWPLKSGPTQLTRRLVAMGDRVYVTLALDAPVTVLDAATGETIRTCEGTANTEELIVSDGVIFAMVNDEPSKWPQYRQEFSYTWDNTNHANRDWAWTETPRRVCAIDAGTGRMLWKATAPVAPMTLSADAKRVYFHDGQKLISLDRRNGRQLWQSELIGRREQMLTCFGPRLIAWKDVVVFAGGDRSMTAVAAETGEKLWSADHPRSGHQSPEDLIIVGDLVFSGAIAVNQDSGIFKGLDPHTGEVKKEFPPDVDIYWFHHRCYPAKATDKFLLTSRTGIEFIDYEKESWLTNHWVRGGCIYGIMPCNGLVYAPPHSCGCYLQSKLCGFNALAPQAMSRPIPKKVPDEGRLERGPAYNKIENQKSKIENPSDWPTYRCDAARSGYTKQAIPTDLKSAWQADLGGRLTSIVVAGGKVFVASIDTHTVHALDAASGKRLWSCTTGGRVDSPPTVWQGRVLFGSADGWVYCLRASDGKLAWRFRAAPVDLRMGAYEQLESLWPVSGSVLVQDGVLSCVAGRSMFLDGGIRMLQLDPKTGRKLAEQILDDRDPQTGENLQSHVNRLIMPVALPDILSSDGQSIYMRGQQFDLKGVRRQIAPLGPDEQTGEGTHLFCQIGFLDDSWFFRSYWLYGRGMGGGYGSWFQAGRNAPSGRIMVFDEDRVYGFARKPQYMVNASVLEYNIYAADRTLKPESIQRVRKSNGPINAKSKNKSANSSDWQVREGFDIKQLWAADVSWADESPPMLVQAMVLADDTLFVAGPLDVVDEKAAFNNPDDPKILAQIATQQAILDGSKTGRTGLLRAVSTADGAKLAEYPLDCLPVFDGMAAANGGLYMATKDGKVRFLTKQ